VTTDAAEATDPTRSAVVIGGGIAGLTAARDLARAGWTVTVHEAAPTLGGTVARASVGGITLDTGAESFAIRGGYVERLIAELGWSSEVVDANPTGAWLQTANGAWPIPSDSLLGIPAEPLSPEVAAIIGRRASYRAWFDRVRPYTGARPDSLGELVRRRMGQRVLDDLVVPVVSGVYSVHPDDLDPVDALPGIYQAMTRAGNLSGAIAQLRGDAKPGSNVRGFRGGIAGIIAILATDLGKRGVTIERNSSIESLDALRDAVDAIVITVPGIDGLGIVPDPDERISIVSLVVDQPELDTFPRGTGVLTVDPAVSAKALTHSSAKWPWLAEALPAGHHALRLSYGGAGRPSADRVSDADLTALAIRDAEALLGVPLPASAVLASHRSRWSSAPAQDVEVVQQAGAVVATTGAWVAGTGLASVVAHARKTVAELLEATESGTATSD